MRSIQSRLTRWLALCMTLLSILTGSGLFIALRQIVVKEFDHSLATRAQVLKSLIVQESTGKFDIDFSPVAMPEYNGKTFRDFFRVTTPDGKTVVSSSSKPINISPPAKDDQLWDLTLPGGVNARAMQINFIATADPDEDLSRDPSVTLFQRTPLTLIVARDRTPLDRELVHISLYISIATTLLTTAAIISTIWIVRRGLSTLRGLASDADAIDVTRPDAQFDVQSLPPELSPIAGRLNEMLNRVAAAFARERRFTADVAHELRTPIAELRLAADIALRDVDNTQLTHRAVTQARDIAAQMQAMVTTLLSIARRESRDDTLAPTPILLADVVNRSLTRYASLIETRKLTIRQGIGPARAIQADRTIFEAVIDNLVSNAVRYATLGGHIRFAATDNDGIQLVICNDQQTLSKDDLRRLFEPFWRKDSARSDGHHVGLGLTLAHAYCEAMGIILEVNLPTPGTFAITLTGQAGAPTATVPTEKTLAYRETN